MCTKKGLTVITQPVRFSFALQIVQRHLVLLLNDKAFVLPSRKTFKRIDSETLKLTLSCLKNDVVWNTCAIKKVY